MLIKVNKALTKITYGNVNEQQFARSLLFYDANLWGSLVDIYFFQGPYSAFSNFNLGHPGLQDV